MSWWTKKLLGPRIQRGRRAESLACAMLEEQGYALVERNVRFPVGEIDIIARVGGTLCFVEVRSTSSQQWGGPLATISDRKRRRIVKAAEWYVHYTKPQDAQMRFDVVSVEWGAGSEPTLELVRDAFTADA
jgi:putative endonuclease